MSNENANLKGQQIATVAQRKRYVRSQYDIEIVDVESIEGGVQVFARAWQNGKQIGFGRDGTVDIERFRIFNPPTLVPNDNGNIVRQWEDEDIETKVKTIRTRKLREDPQEAVLQVIEHNLSVMRNIHSDEKIVQGKIGKTTSTFYSVAGANSPLDGWVRNSGASFATVHDATTGNETNVIDAGTVNHQYTLASSTYYIMRTFFLFDTSAITDTDTVDSATFNWYFVSDGSGGNVNDTNMHLVSSTPASISSLATDDYDAVGSTSFGSMDAWITNGQYNVITINASGLANISKTGTSKFAIRNSLDLANTAPTGINQKQCYMADQTGTTTDPKLVVEHSVSSSYDQALTATADLSASLSRVATYVRTLTKTVTATKSISRTLTLLRTLTDTVTGTATILAGSVYQKALTIVASVTAEMTYESVVAKLLTATAHATATLTKLGAYSRVLTTTATSQTTVTMLKSLHMTFSRTARATASIAKGFFYSKTLTATAHASVLVTRGGLILNRALTVVVTAWVKLNDYFYREKYERQDDDYHIKY